MTTEDRVPPYNEPAEQAFLGAVLLTAAAGEGLPPWLTGIAPAHFYRQKHGAVWQAILAVLARGDPATLGFVTREVDQRGRLEQVGGAPYLVELLRAPESPAYLLHYARAVLTEARRRELLRTCGLLAHAAYDYAGDPAAAITKAEEALAALRATSLPIIEVLMGSEVGGGLVECAGDVLATAAGEASPPSLPLLGRLGYVIRGWSHLVAGYPRVGKTELLVRLVREWLDAGETVVYLTEEPRSVWEYRLRALPGDWSALRVVFGLGEPPAKLLTRATGGGESVVVLDALRNLLCPQDEKDNSELARLVNPWIAAVCRRAGKTFLVGHHDTKSEAEHGKAIAGGHALLGCFDAPLEVTFDGAATQRRIIESHARLNRPPKLVYEQREDGTLRALGDPQGVELAAVARRCTEVLEGAWLSTAEVRALLGDPQPGQEQVRQALHLAARHHDVERDPPLSVERVQGKTVRWRVPTSLPMTSVLVGSEVAVAPPSPNGHAAYVPHPRPEWVTDPRGGWTAAPEEGR